MRAAITNLRDLSAPHAGQERTRARPDVAMMAVRSFLDEVCEG